MSKVVLIIGATSAIAQEIAKVYTVKGYQLCLVARNQSHLQSIAQDLTIQYHSTVKYFVLDVMQANQYESCLQKVYDAFPIIDIAIIAHGTLPDQKACEQSMTLTTQEFQVNAVSYIQLLTILANRFTAQGHGSLIAIGSCAGDRGRQSNYVYGATKAAIAVFMQGLRHRLFSKNIHVMTVKPGFVDTPMTQHFKKGLLWVKPYSVARSIVKAIDHKKSEIYVPWFWSLIMGIIRHIPEKIFIRTNL